MTGETVKTRNPGKLIGRLVIIFGGLFLVWIIYTYNATLDSAKQAIADILQRENDQIQVHEVTVPYLSGILNGEGKALVSNGDTDPVMLMFSITHFGTSIYFEIPASEMGSML